MKWPWVRRSILEAEREAWKQAHDRVALQNYTLRDALKEANYRIRKLQATVVQQAVDKGKITNP